MADERQQARAILERQPANCSAPDTTVVPDKGLAESDTDSFVASPELGQSRALSR